MSGVAHTEGDLAIAQSGLGSSGPGSFCTSGPSRQALQPRDGSRPIQIPYMLDVAEMIATSAMLRSESRGAHATGKTIRKPKVNGSGIHG